MIFAFVEQPAGCRRRPRPPDPKERHTWLEVDRRPERLRFVHRFACRPVAVLRILVDISSPRGWMHLMTVYCNLSAPRAPCMSCDVRDMSERTGPAGARDRPVARLCGVVACLLAVASARARAPRPRPDDSTIMVTNLWKRETAARARGRLVHRRTPQDRALFVTTQSQTQQPLTDDVWTHVSRHRRTDGDI